MKTRLLIVTVCAGISFFAGCAQNQTRIGEGAGFGGLLGAAAGGIIGHQSGHGWEGALIGGAAGAAGGALVGSQIEKPQTVDESTSQVAASVPAVPREGVPLTIQQVVDLTKSGSTGDQIIARIQSTRSMYVLTADDINYLRQNGVSQRVIEAMQAAR